MLQMIQYQNGEVRVIDADRMLASDFLWCGETAARLEDYQLDYTLDPADLEPEYRILRDDTGFRIRNWPDNVPQTGRKIRPTE